MQIRFNTLFVRLAVMAIGLIVLLHFAAVWFIDRERAVTDARHVARLVSLVARTGADDGAAAAKMVAELGLGVAPVGQEIAAGCPVPCTNTDGAFETKLREALPPGSQVVFSRRSGDVWVLYGTSRHWLQLQGMVVPLANLLAMSAAMLTAAIAVALLMAWQFQLPLRRLAKAAREFRLGHRPPPVAASGPGEIRGMIGDFNDMIEQLGEAEEERAVMLAGVAHDLRVPITRIQVRADLVADEADRQGFLRDTESLSRIVTQFLDFASQSSEGTPRAAVDAYCYRHYGESPGVHDPDALIRLDLRAGRSFALPEIDLERILSNLIENALTYGEPSVDISTEVQDDHFILAVRDHGNGIAPDQLERALRPFVRLDPARGGNAHCGLGLAIVRRLVRHNGGSFSASNAEGGGLEIAMRFPALPRRKSADLAGMEMAG